MVAKFRTHHSAVVVASLIFATSWAHAQVASHDAPARAAASFRPDRILIQPKVAADSSKLMGLHAKKGVKTIRSFQALNDIQVLHLPANVNAADAVQEYLKSGLVEFAEPDYYLHTSRVPNESSFENGALWGLNNTGKTGGVPDADIDAPEAWDLLTSASNVVVAVVDTGVRYTHEDLAANMWRNPGEKLNGIDDDKNGIVDDIYGFNAINDSGNPNDDSGHGTHVAGIIGAVGNNGKGVVGVAWKVKIMACKFMDADGSGATSDAIQCIDYARKNGAKIINASWGGGAYSLALLRAIQRARDAGIILVTAAGNELANNDITPSYPANYNADNVLSVAATTRNDYLDSEYSNYGKLTVDLAAPGTRIYSTWNSSDSSYTYESGTSMAAPVVSGVLALMRANEPNKSYRELIKQLLAGTDKLPSLAGKCVSGGRVNLQKALGITPSVSGTTALLAIKPDSAWDAKGFVGGPFDLNPGVYQLSNLSNEMLSWSVEHNEPWLSISSSGSSIEAGKSLDVTVSINDRASLLPIGNYSDSLAFSTPEGTNIVFAVHLTIMPLPSLEVVDSSDPKQFQFRLSADTAYACVTEASTDFQNWAPISTNSIASDGKLFIGEPLMQGQLYRFFRSKLIPRSTLENPIQ